MTLEPDPNSVTHENVDKLIASVSHQNARVSTLGAIDLLYIRVHGDELPHGRVCDENLIKGCYAYFSWFFHHG